MQEEGNIPYVIENGVGTFETQPAKIAAIIKSWLKGTAEEQEAFANMAQRWGKSFSVLLARERIVTCYIMAADRFYSETNGKKLFAAQLQFAFISSTNWYQQENAVILALEVVLAMALVHIGVESGQMASLRVFNLVFVQECRSGGVQEVGCIVGALNSMSLNIVLTRRKQVMSWQVSHLQQQKRIAEVVKDGFLPVSAGWLLLRRRRALSPSGPPFCRSKELGRPMAVYEIVEDLKQLTDEPDFE